MEPLLFVPKLSITILLFLLESVLECALFTLMVLLLLESLQELIPFPNLPVFKPMRALHTKLCVGRSLADEFVQVLRSCRAF